MKIYIVYPKPEKDTKIHHKEVNNILYYITKNIEPLNQYNIFNQIDEKYIFKGLA